MPDTDNPMTQAALAEMKKRFPSLEFEPMSAEKLVDPFCRSMYQEISTILPELQSGTLLVWEETDETPDLAVYVRSEHVDNLELWFFVNDPYDNVYINLTDYHDNSSPESVLELTRKILDEDLVLVKKYRGKELMGSWLAEPHNPELIASPVNYGSWKACCLFPFGIGRVSLTEIISWRGTYNRTITGN